MCFLQIFLAFYQFGLMCLVVTLTSDNANKKKKKQKKKQKKKTKGKKENIYPYNDRLWKSIVCTLIDLSLKKNSDIKNIVI